MTSIVRRVLPAVILSGALALAATGCVAGENAARAQDHDGSGSGAWSTDSLSIDWATYNPLSIVVKDQGLIEQGLGGDVDVEWVQSAGSNKANELLRSGSIDVGSTAGSAALLARANGSPIRVIDIYSQPEWSALVVPADSNITSVADLAGRKVAATVGADPYFFLLQALDTAGLTIQDVDLQNLQHADGWAALSAGSVDAWSGLDPIMASAEVDGGAKLLYRNVDFNSYGFLDATEQFLTDHSDIAQVVVDAYEQARTWALAHPDETAQLLATAADIEPAVATKVIAERSNLDVAGVPGDDQLKVLRGIAPVLVASGDVAGGQDAIDEALRTIIEPAFAERAKSRQ